MKNNLYHGKPVVIKVKYGLNNYKEEIAFFDVVKLSEQFGKEYYFYTFYGPEDGNYEGEWRLDSYVPKVLKNILKLNKEHKREFIRKIFLVGAP